MKADQIAYYCSTEADELKLKRSFGLTKWVEDEVTAKSWIYGMQGYYENIAKLQFNYELGIELEIIRYVSGPNWHMMRNPLIVSGICQSHIGIHLNPDDDFEPGPGLMIQETWTQFHTTAIRRYHYRIYELAPATYIKYIKRVSE